MNQLEKLSPDLARHFQEKAIRKLPSYGVNIYAPNGNHVEVPFFQEGADKPGYLCERYVFDNLLFQFAASFDSVSIFEGTPVKEVQRDVKEVRVQLPDMILNAPVLVGADGANSIVNQSFDTNKIDRRYHSAGLRVYYEGVKGFHPGNHVELHFFKEILPGYVWVFPMEEGKPMLGSGYYLKRCPGKELICEKLLSECFLSILP